MTTRDLTARMLDAVQARSGGTALRVACGLLMFAAACGDGPTALGGGAGTITFLRSIQQQLSTMNGDGSHQEPLGPSGRATWDYEWSPDGAWIAVLSGGEHVNVTQDSGISIFRAGGVREQVIGKQFAGTINWVHWAPNGADIAFTSGGEVYRINRGGFGLLQLSFGAISAEDPQWSPNGAQVLFGRTNDTSFVQELWIAAANGSGSTQVPVPDNALHARWSPHGDWIAYDNGLGIWLVKPDGTGRHPLSTNCSAGICSDSAEFQYPRWAPDASRIACTARPNTNLPDLYIYVLSPDSLSSVAVAPGQNPDWSLDSRLIAYEDATSHISLAAVSGHATRSLTTVVDAPDWDRWPRWRP